MKHLSTILLVSLATLGNAGCGESHHERHTHAHHQASNRHYKPGDGSIDLQDNTVVIRAGGTTEDARVAPDGSLTIGGQPVDINGAGRAALKDYDSAAVAIQDHAVAIGVAGAKFGWNTVREVLRGMFTGQSDEADRHAEEGTQALAESVKQLCGRLAGMYKAQQDAAAAVHEFQPYAVISQRQVDECFSEDDEHGHANPNDDDDDDAEPAKPEA